MTQKQLKELGINPGDVSLFLAQIANRIDNAAENVCLKEGNPYWWDPQLRHLSQGQTHVIYNDLFEFFLGHPATATKCLASALVELSEWATAEMECPAVELSEFDWELGHILHLTRKLGLPTTLHTRSPENISKKALPDCVRAIVLKLTSGWDLDSTPPEPTPQQFKQLYDLNHKRAAAAFWSRRPVKQFATQETPSGIKVAVALDWEIACTVIEKQFTTTPSLSQIQAEIDACPFDWVQTKTKWNPFDW